MESPSRHFMVVSGKSDVASVQVDNVNAETNSYMDANVYKT